MEVVYLIGMYVDTFEECSKHVYNCIGLINRSHVKHKSNIYAQFHKMLIIIL